MQDVKKILKEIKLPKLLDFLRWKSIDLYRFIKYKPPIHLYGVRCVCGLYGMGKTITMSQIALNYREKYKDKIYICSNYGLAIQDFPFTDVSQLTETYNKPIIFLFDEVQNEFPSTEKVLPKPVRQALSLNRKGNGKMIYWASQDAELVHKTFRRLTIEYLQVKTILKRYTKVRTYMALDYLALSEENDIKKRIKIRPIKTFSFVQSDFVRNLYNSFGWDNGEALTDKEGLKNIKK